MSDRDPLLSYGELKRYFQQKPDATDQEAAEFAGLDPDDDDQAVIQVARDDARGDVGPWHD